GGRLHGEGQPVCLTRIEIGVLPQNHHLHLLWARELQRSECLVFRWVHWNVVGTRVLDEFREPRKVILRALLGEPRLPSIWHTGPETIGRSLIGMGFHGRALREIVVLRIAGIIPRTTSGSPRKERRHKPCKFFHVILHRWCRPR